MLELGRHLGDSYFDTLAFALKECPSTALEFGVATGNTLRMIANVMPVVGFDSFEGLPEDWRAGFEKGRFAQAVPSVPGAEIVVGWFDDTLPEWVDNNSQFLSRLKLVHIDCDLYSSTKTVLDHIGPYLVGGTVVVFDEYHGYPGWEDHEYRAWQEFVEKSAVEFDILGHGPEQLAVRIR